MFRESVHHKSLNRQPNQILLWAFVLRNGRTAVSHWQKMQYICRKDARQDKWLHACILQA